MRGDQSVVGKAGSGQAGGKTFAGIRLRARFAVSSAGSCKDSFATRLPAACLSDDKWLKKAHTFLNTWTKNDNLRLFLVIMTQQCCNCNKTCQNDTFYASS